MGYVLPKSGNIVAVCHVTWGWQISHNL